MFSQTDLFVLLSLYLQIKKKTNQKQTKKQNINWSLAYITHEQVNES